MRNSFFMLRMLSPQDRPCIAPATMARQNIQIDTLIYIVMDDKEFGLLAHTALSRIQAGLENAGLDFETPADGILEVEFDDGSKIVINRHSTAQEIWVAARSGGYHFQPAEDGWEDSRDGEDLYIKLARLIKQQGGALVLF